MALIVGNLLTDPAANSFISLLDAEAYLADEGAGADLTTPLGRWFVLGASEKESSLVRASRWLAATYRFIPLDAAGLTRVGHVAARLAAESTGTSMFTGVNVTGQKKRVKAGSVEVEYRDGVMTAHAAGMYWPWLDGMLYGLIRTSLSYGAIVV